MALIRYRIYKGKRALLAQIIACIFAQKRHHGTPRQDSTNCTFYAKYILRLNKTYHRLVENFFSPRITVLSFPALEGSFGDIIKIRAKKRQFYFNVSNFDPQSTILVVML